MVFAFLTKALILVLGYIYPAYDCYKAVELNKPEIDQLRFWCQYWILIAILTVFERVADNFVSWLPMYSEAKLAFIVYLWYPNRKGTSYVYDTFFRPYLSRHETQIDRHLLEFHTRASDVASVFFLRVASYGQSRFYEVLQYVAAQSDTSSGSRNVPRRPRPQPSQTGNRMPSQQPNGTASGQPPPVPSTIPPEQQRMQSEGDSTSRPQQILQEVTRERPSSGEAAQINGADVTYKATLMGEAIRATTDSLRRRLARDTGHTSSPT
ncbi:HVA22-like protein [Rhynchospora pubera]|uniref:HVA22-like protein n=1 Tax=Rhynchospora pubera TaxID=906938 RepID=A0AAV8DPM1_9POAL|nr:HVA22-like protein [Rhynchospora pubera]